MRSESKARACAGVALNHKCGEVSVASTDLGSFGLKVEGHRFLVVEKGHFERLLAHAEVSLCPNPGVDEGIGIYRPVDNLEEYCGSCILFAWRDRF